MAFLNTLALKERLDEIDECLADLDEAFDAYDRGDAPDRGDCDYAYLKLDDAERALSYLLAPVLAALSPA